MTLLTDENLMAYVDNTLDATTRQQLETALQNNQSAQSRLQQFKKSAAALRLFDDVLEETIPPSISQLFSDENQKTINSENVVPINNSTEQQPFKKPYLAMAASIIFCAGITIGLIMPSLWNKNIETTGILQMALPNVLEYQKSGEPIAHEWNQQQYEIMILGTYATNDNRYCRSFELTHLPGHTRVGLACRSARQQWDVHTLLAADALAGIKQENNHSYQPASSGRELIDAAIKSLGAETSISLNKEETLLKQQWNNRH